MTYVTVVFLICHNKYKQNTSSDSAKAHEYVAFIANIPAKGSEWHHTRSKPTEVIECIKLIDL